MAFGPRAIHIHPNLRDDWTTSERSLSPRPWYKSVSREIRKVAASTNLGGNPVNQDSALQAWMESAPHAERQAAHEHCNVRSSGVSCILVTSRFAGLSVGLTVTLSTGSRVKLLWFIDPRSHCR